MTTGLYSTDSLVKISSPDFLGAVIVAVPKPPSTEDLSAYISVGNSASTDTLTSIYSDYYNQVNSVKNPSLQAYVYILAGTSINEYDLSAFVYAKPPPISTFTELNNPLFSQGSAYLINSSLNPNLKANINPIPKRATSNLSAFLRPVNPDTHDLSAYYVSTEQDTNDLSAEVKPQEEVNLLASVVPTFTGIFNLSSVISGIPPEDLQANIQPIFEENLQATVSPVPPIDLQGSLSVVQVKNLQAEIEAVNTLTLPASVAGVLENNLSSIIVGVGNGFENLGAEYQAKLGTKVPNDLNASITGVFSDTADLNSKYTVSIPKDLSGSYEAIQPLGLRAIVSTAEPVNLSAEYVAFEPEGILKATITGVGGFNNLNATIFPSFLDTFGLNAQIVGQALEDLQASVNPVGSFNLLAEIQVDTTQASNLSGHYNAQDINDLNAIYDLAVSQSLEASITPIEASTLGARIKPKFYYIESSLLLNTFAVEDLQVYINADPCNTLSNFENLAVFIQGQSASNLKATVVSVAGQYTISKNQAIINRLQLNTYQNWNPIALIDPAIAYNKLRVDLVTSPFLDLQVFIEAIPASRDLSASIQPRYYSIPTVQGGTAPIVNWVNDQTGETKSVRIFFKGPNLTYYYSSTANTTFTLDPFTEMVVVVESYVLDPNGTILSTKGDVKQCIVSNLENFSNIDAAIKYGIECAVGTYGDNLFASINAIGSFSDLNVQITAVEDTVDLNAKYNIVKSSPDLNATINGKGLFNDLSFYLTPVISSATLGSTNSPDLSAMVVGIGVQDLGATISGN